MIPTEYLAAEHVKKYLVELNMNSNPLIEIPESIGLLSSLKILGISYTEVEEIPKALVSIPDFDQLYCFGTNLKKP